MRARIVMVNNALSSLVRFSNFSEDFRQTNCGVALKIDRPTMLKWNIRHMSRLQKKPATICFDVLLPRTTFVGFGLSSKTHMVDCCFI